MSDGVSEMWYKYERYKELCKELNIEHMSIDEDWLTHYFNLLK